MGLERNIKTLTELGLTQTEAEIYIFLTQNGTQGKEAIANTFNISEDQLNGTLSELQDKGFISVEISRSKAFSALPLETVLEKIVDSKLRAVKLAIKEREEFLKPERIQTKTEEQKEDLQDKRNRGGDK